MNRSTKRALLSQIRKMDLAKAMTLVSNVLMREPWEPLNAGERERSSAIVRSVIRAGATWYHGGAATLSEGDVLLPSEITGADPRGERSSVGNRSRFVFFTQEMRLAWTYARHCAAGGAVYQIEPLDQIEVDAVNLRTYDFLDVPFAPNSFCCQRAKVVRRIDQDWSTFEAEIRAQEAA